MWKKVALLCLTYQILCPLILPFQGIHWLMPLISFLFLFEKRSLFLLTALLSGFYLDLLSSHSFPLYALAYLGTSLCFLPYKSSFIPDFRWNFALVNSLFSFTCQSFISLFLLFQGFSLSGSTILSDLLCIPFFEGLYCLLCISPALRRWRKKTAS